MRQFIIESKSCFRLMLTGVSLAALALSSAPSLAQTGPEAAEAPLEAGPIKDSNVGDIVVTARRTDERLQDVPIAVTAFDSDGLRELRIDTQTDLQSVTPGLIVRQTGSSDELNYSIRGQTIDAFSYSAPAVVSYFNEVPISGGAGSTFYDLKSIQVLKGPQGTLFGRNATGGAVLYSTQDPTRNFGGYLRAGIGNYDNRELEGALNLPVTGGIALRFAGKLRKRDGFQNNLLTGTHPNSIDSKTGRVSLLIAPPASGLRNVTVFQATDFGGRTGAVKMKSANGVNGAPATYFDPITGTTQPLVTNFRDIYQPGVITNNPRVNALFDGIGDFLTKQKEAGFYDVFINPSQLRTGHQYLVTNTTTLELNDFLTLKNIFGYNDSYLIERTDISGAPYEFLRVADGPGTKGEGYNFGNEHWSNEVQIAGEFNRFNIIAGAFYSTEDAYTYTPISITPDLGGGFVGAFDFTLFDRSKALYAQASYAVTDRLNFSAGFRYTWEHVRIEQTPGPGSLLGASNDGNRRDRKPSWLVGVDYRVTPDLMVYFNHRGSWRTGGFNGTSGANFPEAAPFKPETTYDFEAGAKFSGYIGSVRSRVNLALYDQHIKDVQRTTYFNIAALASNVNSARVTGAEVDASFDLVRWLQVGGAFSYSDARYDDPKATVVGAEFIFGPYGDAPKLSGSAYFRAFTKLAANKGELVLRGDGYGQSHFYYSSLGNTITPNTRIKGYGLFNLRGEWNAILGSKVGAAVYVKNLTQKHYEVGGFPLSPVTGSTGTLPGVPRTYGVEIGVAF